jgi:hypothetical protein
MQLCNRFNVRASRPFHRNSNTESINRGKCSKSTVDSLRFTANFKNNIQKDALCWSVGQCSRDILTVFSVAAQKLQQIFRISIEHS